MPTSYDCDICAEAFNDSIRLPKVLPCQHTFCLECLLKMDSNGSITCPMDRMVFNVDIATELPGNLYIQSRLEFSSGVDGTTNRRDISCDSEGGAGAREDSPQLQLLANLAEQREELLAALRAMRDGVLAALQDRVQAEEQLLKRARDCIEGLQQQPSAGAQELRQEAASLLHAGAALGQDLRILQSGSATVSADGGWHSKRVQLSEQPALQLAALQLRQQDSLEWEPSQQEQQEPQAEQGLCQPPRRWDAGDTTWGVQGELNEDKEQMLVSNAPIHGLTYMWCCKEPDFTQSQLWKHAAHLEEVHLYAPGRPHLLAVQSMPRLRKLQVHYVEDKTMGALPSPPGEEGSGLTWLQLVQVPRDTAKSLIAANGHSLRKLRLGVGLPAKQPLVPLAADWTDLCEDLEVFLRGCELQRLESLTLVREKRCRQPNLCVAQQTRARRELPRNCRVRCTFCRDWVNEAY